MLSEGNLYGIKNFILFDDTFPRMFQFKTFEQIISVENIYDAQLYDVFRILTSKPATQTYVNFRGAETKFVEIVLMDKEKKTLTCTLWENCANELLGQLRGSEMLNIVILQMAKPNMYKGHIKNILHDELSTITAAICVSQNSAQTGSQSIMNEISSAETVLRTIEQLYTYSSPCLEIYTTPINFKYWVAILSLEDFGS
ncbi:hypothetical protein OROHE_002875 [Orobanche hederae]